MINELLPILIEQGERWISDQRERFRPIASSLSKEDRDRFHDCFAPAILDLARFAWVEEIENPEFYAALGIGVPLDFRLMAGITFVDTLVVSRSHFQDVAGWPVLLFHELVHVLQYRILGAHRFVLDYVDGWAANGLQYEKIPLEAMAYALQARYVSKGCFPVEAEVRRGLGAAA